MWIIWNISTFSFYANKHITTGEGGMIINNKKYMLACKSLRNLSFGEGFEDLNTMKFPQTIDYLIFKPFRS